MTSRSIFWSTLLKRSNDSIALSAPQKSLINPRACQSHSHPGASYIELLMTILEHQGRGDLLALNSTLDSALSDLQLSVDFFDRARSFAAAADAMVAEFCRDGSPRLHLPVIAFLLAQSIELALKGFLLEKKWTFDKIKNELGHSLPKARAAAEQLGFGKPAAYDCHLFELLDKAYRHEQHYPKKLQYPPSDGFLTIPSLKALRELSVEILGEVAIVLSNRQNYELAMAAPTSQSFGLKILNNANYSGPSLAELRDKWFQASIAGKTP